jgi:hypothetical protein
MIRLLRYFGGIVLMHFMLAAQGQVSVTDFGEMDGLQAAINRGETNAVRGYKSMIGRAEKAMQQGPYSVTDKTGMPPSGDPGRKRV